MLSTYPLIIHLLKIKRDQEIFTRFLSRLGGSIEKAKKCRRRLWHTRSCLLLQ